MGVLCIVLLLFFMAIGVQIGLSFILSGLLTGVIMFGLDQALLLLGQSAYYSIASPTWTAIPLFILLGAFASDGGLAKRAYDAAHSLMRNIKGSLLMATSLSCGIFGAVSGSSIATAAIFGRMALPEMYRLGYDKKLSVATIAAAGTFASMIPPSMMMIIYGLFTQQSIAKLFAAGVIPGLVTMIAYFIYIYLAIKRNSKLAPNYSNDNNINKKNEQPNIYSQSRMQSLIALWPVVIIAVAVLGGIYSGLTTPTEAAAVGAVVVLILGVLLKDLSGLKTIGNAMRDSGNVTAMLFLINIGALYYSRILAFTGLPSDLTTALGAMNLTPFWILFGVMAIMFFLGMIMVPIGIYALTLPIVFPILVANGYDPIWFGVIALKLTEIGAISPPVGLNVFAVKGVLPKNISISTDQIYHGCLPFIAVEIVVLAVLVAFPQLSLWLPNLIT